MNFTTILSMPNQREQSILKTLIYFNLLDTPTTAENLWQKLWHAPADFSQTDFHNALAELVKQNVIERDTTASPQSVPTYSSGGLRRLWPTEQDFYFLPGRSNLMQLQRQRQADLQKKYQIAQRAGGILKFVNGIKAIAVCNSLAWGNIKPDSDIDFFIIGQKNRLWLVRLCATAVLLSTDLWRHGKLVNNKICLSFFITEDYGSLEKLLLPEGDPHFCWWLSSFNFIYNNGGLQKFQADNEWLKKILPNLPDWRLSPVYQVMDSRASRVIKKINSLWFDNFLGTGLNNLAGRLQQKKMSLNLNSLAQADDTRVVINNQILKFHETDNRLERRETWLEKIKTVLE